MTAAAINAATSKEKAPTGWVTGEGFKRSDFVLQTELFRTGLN